MYSSTWYSIIGYSKREEYYVEYFGPSGQDHNSAGDNEYRRIGDVGSMPYGFLPTSTRLDNQARQQAPCWTARQRRSCGRIRRASSGVRGAISSFFSSTRKSQNYPPVSV